jgi:hypothetical protein
MQLDQLVPVDEMAAALESGRRRLASIDIDGIQESAMSVARSVLPDAWSRPKPRRRWPLVGAVLVIGAAILGLIFLTPMLRRGAASSRAMGAWSASDSHPATLPGIPDDTLSGAADERRVGTGVE